MTCHNCKHSREIARHLKERSRLLAFCSKCTLGEHLPGDGSISLDAMLDGTADRIAKVAPNHPTSYTYDPGQIDEPRPEPDEETKTRDALTTLLACVADLPYSQISKLATLCDVFRRLSKSEFEIVAHMLRGGTMTEYAEANGLTKQTAFARIKALFAAHPVFRAIANGGLTHGKGGRKAAKRTYQPTLFDFTSEEAC